MLKQDLTLALYQDMLKINHAHYGLWLPSEELTIQNMKKAMNKYSDHLIQKIPDDSIQSLMQDAVGVEIL
jgi:hypothetical protein